MRDRENLWFANGSYTDSLYKSKGGGETVQRQHEIHARELLDSMNSIRDSMERIESSTNEIVFRVHLDRRAKFSRSRSISSNAMKVIYSPREHEAIVTMTRDAFNTMDRKLQTYETRVEKNNKTLFADIDFIAPNIGQGKVSARLKGAKDSSPVSVVAMSRPDCEDGSDFIKEYSGGDHRKIYSDGKRISIYEFHADSATISMMEMDPYVLSVSPVEMCTVPSAVIGTIDLVLELDDSVDLNSLGTTVIFDTGVRFPSSLENVIIAHRRAEGIGECQLDHGTEVAWKAAFGNQPVVNGVPLKPRTRVVDYQIMDRSRDRLTDVLMRVREGARMYGDADAFVLCLNAEVPLESETISTSARIIDDLHSELGGRFFISAGNHQVWRGGGTIQDILSDEDCRISEPADAVTAMTIGSVTGASHAGSISPPGYPAPYTRRGPGFAGIEKPNFCEPCAALLPNGTVPADVYSTVYGKHGITHVAGTSFAAPVAAGDYVSILSRMPGENGDLALASILNRCYRVDVTDTNMSNALGRGVFEPESVLGSSSEDVNIAHSGSITPGMTRTFMLPEMKDSGPLEVKVTCFTDPVIDHNMNAECIQSTAFMFQVGESETTVPDRFLGGWWNPVKERTFRVEEGEEFGFVLRPHVRGSYSGEVRYALAVSIRSLNGADVHSALLRSEIITTRSEKNKVKTGKVMI